MSPQNFALTEYLRQELKIIFLHATDNNLEERLMTEVKPLSLSLNSLFCVFFMYVFFLLSSLANTLCAIIPQNLVLPT